MADVQYSGVDRLSIRYLRRPVTHLTPRDLVNRSRLWAYQRRYPDGPWLTADAIKVLKSFLRSTDCGLEFGAGRSTQWFARRVESLISIETSAEWYARVTDALSAAELRNVDLRHIRAAAGVPNDPYRQSYINVSTTITLRSLDFVLVDGLYRDDCALRVVDLVKPGGVLIVDNANRYVPHDTHSPFSVKNVNSNTWSEFLDRVSSWRLQWTSNGVTDTALWFNEGSSSDSQQPDVRPTSPEFLVPGLDRAIVVSVLARLAEQGTVAVSSLALARILGVDQAGQLAPHARRCAGTWASVASSDSLVTVGVSGLAMMTMPKR